MAPVRATWWTKTPVGGSLAQPDACEAASLAGRDAEEEAREVGVGEVGALVVHVAEDDAGQGGAAQIDVAPEGLREIGAAAIDAGGGAGDVAAGELAARALLQELGCGRG